jgi:hypothetical protein
MKIEEVTVSYLLKAVNNYLDTDSEILRNDAVYVYVGRTRQLTIEKDSIIVVPSKSYFYICDRIDKCIDQVFEIGDYDLLPIYNEHRNCEFFKALWMDDQFAEWNLSVAFKYSLKRQAVSNFYRLPYIQKI